MSNILHYNISKMKILPNIYDFIISKTIDSRDRNQFIEKQYDFKIK